MRCIGGSHKLLIAGPLYNAMAIAPAKDMKVPVAFANPRGFRKLRVSSLQMIGEYYKGEFLKLH